LVTAGLSDGCADADLVGIVASLSAFMADFAPFAACLDDEGQDRDTPGRNYAVPWGIGKYG